MAKKTYQGSCHCKAVRFEAGIDLAEGTGKCNCTSCWKKRWWSCRAKPEDFKLLSATTTLSNGERGGFCKQCGVHVYGFVDKADWNPAAYVSIGVNALDDLDPAELLESPIKYMDGRKDDWWHVPAETRHL